MAKIHDTEPIKRSREHTHTHRRAKRAKWTQAKCLLSERRYIYLFCISNPPLLALAHSRSAAKQRNIPTNRGQMMRKSKISKPFKRKHLNDLYLRLLWWFLRVRRARGFFPSADEKWDFWYLSGFIILVVSSVFVELAPLQEIENLTISMFVIRPAQHGLRVRASAQKNKTARTLTGLWDEPTVNTFYPHTWFA